MEKNYFDLAYQLIHKEDKPNSILNLEELLKNQQSPTIKKRVVSKTPKLNQSFDPQSANNNAFNFNSTSQINVENPNKPVKVKPSHKRVQSK